jgi:hypothetical protein
MQERVGNTLELIGIGKNFLNGTPAAQLLNWIFVLRIVIHSKTLLKEKRKEKKKNLQGSH